ncbi:alpha/beta hydrolase [Roseixanthobacter liquoris]|uniref:alpha/beta hydrolase n=1 Tax=Roseixanthobacter liquoris TaxID=3119921 RepID=UPI003728ECD2
MIVGAALLSGAFTVSAADAAPARNVILVHGALADGSGWMGVYHRLKAKGYKVQVVQQPQTSEEEDVQAVKRAIALADGPVVLVGHSYGGQLITEAGDDPKVTALVYVAAAVPDVGESLEDLFKITPSPTADAIRATPDGFLMLDPARFHDAFAADLPGDQSDFMADSQVMIAAKAFDTKTKVAAWKVKRSYGIVPQLDRTASPVLERFMYTRANAEITEIPGASHAVFVSHPAEVAAVIEKAAAN